MKARNIEPMPIGPILTMPRFISNHQVHVACKSFQPILGTFGICLYIDVIWKQKEYKVVLIFLLFILAQHGIRLKVDCCQLDFSKS